MICSVEHYGIPRVLEIQPVNPAFRIPSEDRKQQPYSGQKKRSASGLHEVTRIG